MDLYNDIYGAPVFDVYDNEKEKTMAVLRAAMEECLAGIKRDLHEEMEKMRQYWKDEAAVWRKMVKSSNGPVNVEMVNDLKVSTKPQPLVTSSFKPSTVSPPKYRRLRTVPIRRRQRHITRARKPEKCNRRNSSKHGSRFVSRQPRKLSKLHGSSFLWWRVRVSSQVMPSRVKENLFGTHGKRPFDRGRARLVRGNKLSGNKETHVSSMIMGKTTRAEEMKKLSEKMHKLFSRILRIRVFNVNNEGKIEVLVQRMKTKKNYESVFFIRTLRTRFFSGGGVLMRT